MSRARRIRRKRRKKSGKPTAAPEVTAKQAATVPVMARRKTKTASAGVLEEEAHHAANAVMRQPQAEVIQRQVSEEEQREETGEAEAQPEAETEAAEKEEDEEEPVTIQRESQGAGAGGAEAAGSVASAGLTPAVRQSSGRPLAESDRQFFEANFDQDFSSVRIHDDSPAAEASQAVDARAFTVGEDVYFNRGELATGTSEGQKLMAHELAHVVQQRGVRQPEIQRQEAEPSKAGQPTAAAQLAGVKSLHVEQLKGGVAGANAALQRAIARRKTKIEQDLAAVRKVKAQAWADKKIKALEADLAKDVDAIVATADSHYVDKSLRADVIKWHNVVAAKTAQVAAAKKEFKRYDRLFAAKAVEVTLAKKGFTVADLKAIVAQESGDLTITDQKGDKAGIAQIGKKEATEVGGKPQDRLDPKTAIPLAAKVLIKKAELLEAALNSRKLPIPTGLDYKKFVFASYNAGSATIASAAAEAKARKLDSTSWSKLTEGELKSALYAGIKKHLKNPKAKYTEITDYVHRVLKRLP